jgi:hypothetical protein
VRVIDAKQVAVLLGVLLLSSPSLAETPCDFKGISVGNKMSPTELMSALGMTQFKDNPSKRSFDQIMPLVKKYGLTAAGDLEDWEIGPYCNNTSCHVPYGIAVGNNNGVPVKVDIAFQEGLITEIVVSFSEVNWDEMGPIFDQKYGADWTIERYDMPITNYETKESLTVQRIVLQHVTKGTNLTTKDRCQIWATNFDIVFEHHDAFGPYHSELLIQLISKNF